MSYHKLKFNHPFWIYNVGLEVPGPVDFDAISEVKLEFKTSEYISELDKELFTFGNILNWAGDPFEGMIIDEHTTQLFSNFFLPDHRIIDSPVLHPFLREVKQYYIVKFGGHLFDYWDFEKCVFFHKSVSGEILNEFGLSTINSLEEFKQTRSRLRKEVRLSTLSPKLLSLKQNFDVILLGGGEFLFHERILKNIESSNNNSVNFIEFLEYDIESPAK